MIAKRTGCATIVVCCLSISLALAHASLASAASPWWRLTSRAAPSDIAPGGEGNIIAEAVDVGDASLGTEEVLLSDTLPVGMTVAEGSASHLALVLPGLEGAGELLGKLLCTSSGDAVSCAIPAGSAEQILSYQLIRLEVPVHSDVDGSSGSNLVVVSGGGAPRAATRRDVRNDGAPTAFGIESYELTPEDTEGTEDDQAGSHPFQVVATVVPNASDVAAKPPALVKDLQFNLPAGLVGDVTPFAQCTEIEFTTIVSGGTNLCPTDTAVGVVVPVVVKNGALESPAVPLFNLTPDRGEPARFGFDVAGVPVYLDTSVRTGRNYEVVVSVRNITEVDSFIAARTIFWGVPGDPRHDQSRGWNCIEGGKDATGPCAISHESAALPLLTLPTSCAGSMKTSVEADSWAAPAGADARLGEPLEPAFEESLVGCDRLQFDPTIGVEPDGNAASTPSGLKVDVHVSPEGSSNPTGLAESDVQSVTVTLPPGLTIDPAGAGGLQACSIAQIGFLGVDPATGSDEFTPSEPSCPSASKVGLVDIATPLLAHPLEGAVYLAAPQNYATGPLENPFAALVAMYIVAEDPVSGVLVKLAGKVTADPVTGQLTATFGAPQLPFEEARLDFFGSARAPLSTPALCGAYTTSAAVAPWSDEAAATPSSSFQIVTGPDGGGPGGCSAPRQFAPGFEAGSTNVDAGAFTPVTAEITRPDADQPLGRIEAQMPPGLSGRLASVALCGEPQALLGTCGEESLIGHTVVSVGLGGEPYTVSGGKVYLTTGYRGASFGLSVVSPATAGPFVLDEGRPIVVRASVYVDPDTAALRIVSDPLPTILDGIPLEIQHVDVTVERPGGFTFNPTNCGRMAITGALSSGASASESATAAVATPFQVTNCAALAFKPKFKVSTSGKTSRLRGASLTAKLEYPNAPQGAEANIAKVRVELPKRLPSRLKTLQKACVAATFLENPADCPVASRVGMAKAKTPVLPVALSGPAYFVSHGGAKFPELIVVLQGDDVTIDLHGETSISSKGITSSTFRQVPDVPVSSFELKLPEGPYSALAANASLCKGKLAMATELAAQNGAVLRQSTKLAVVGCPKRRKHTRSAGTSRALVKRRSR